MDRLIHHLTQSPDGVGIYFYSDNLYIVVKKENRVRWLSMDGAKMECSHDDADAVLYVDHILSHYSHVDPGTKRAYSDIARRAMVNATVQLGKQRFPITWLSSGYPDTAEINCLKMAQITTVLLHIHNARHGSPIFTDGDRVDEIRTMFTEDPLSHNRDLVEMAVNGELAGVFAHFGVTMTVEHYDSNLLGTLQHDQYARLDFLGYGVATSPFLNDMMGRAYYFPCLELERMVKSIVFPKSFRSFEKLKSETGNRVA